MGSGWHPVHPAITDIPIGAWTVAVVLDQTEAKTRRKRLRKGADMAVAVGLAGAVGSAVTGASDWQYLSGAPRRIGLVHALLNITATLLFAASLVLRSRKHRAAGRNLALLGYSTSIAAAYLGGHLAFWHKIGVSHAPAPQTLPDTFRPVMALADLPDKELRRIDVDGIPVVIIKREDQVFALAETCAHLGGPLASGTYQEDDNSVICPWHGSRYAMSDGRVLNGPSPYNQPCFEIRILNGQIELKAPAIQEG